MNSNIIFNYRFYFILIFIIGIFFRNHNINFDDFWVDEISTFWISNPNIDIFTSYKNNSSLELQPVFYNFAMRIFYSIFGYNDDYGRYVSSVFSSLSILSISYISWIISKNRSYLLVAFLVSFNIYLISYSHEMRVYSLIFFLISLSILFYFLSLKKENFINIFFLNLTILLSIFLHPFSLILLFSISIHIFLLFTYNKIFFKKISFTIVGIFLASIVYYYFHFKNLIPNNSEAYFFLKGLNLKFITNMYFSKFFGSRIVGVCFLLLFILAIKRLLRKIVDLKEVSFLLILFLFSYTLPIIYGYLFHPIIQPKYIIFVLIPIILIISEFIFDLNKKPQIILISFVLILTIGNLITEQSIKQYFFERPPHKPEINKSLYLINNSNYKDYLIKVDPYDNVKIPWTFAVKNYLVFLQKKNKLNLNYLEDISQISNYAWIICIHDLNYHGCDYKNVNVEKKINLNRLTLSLVFLE
jgi:hypothetical protein